MKHKIIFINGPPGSGKDQASMIIARVFGARPYKISRALKEALTGFFAIDYFEVKNIYEVDKDKPRAEFNGLSWRQLQISLSEEWAKRVLGDDVFGRIARTHLNRPTSFDMTVISDSGFYDECVPIVQRFSPDACFLIQLTREGCSFEGDSRSYIELDDLGVTTVLLDNRYPLIATVDMPITFEIQLTAAVNGWLGVDTLL